MFNELLKDTFTLFSTQHLTAVALLFITLYVIYSRRNVIKDKYYNLRYYLAAATILQEISLHIYRIFNGNWTLSNALPLHLCSLGVIGTAYILVSENKKFFLTTYFVMMIGAVMAFLTPSITDNVGFPHYRFIQFFFAHGMILVNISFILFVMEWGKDFKYKHIYHNMLFLMGLAVFDLIINLITGGNYLYLMAKPGPNTAFDLFGNHPWYIVNILLIGMPILFHLFYIPFYFYNRKQLIKKRA